MAWPSPLSTESLLAGWFNIELSLYKDSLEPGYSNETVSLCPPIQSVHCAIWVLSGSLLLNGNELTKGVGSFLNSTDTLSNNGAETVLLLRFVLNSALDHSFTADTSDRQKSKLLYSENISLAESNALFRLDQIDFPPAATAYRHTHPGPGIRFLVLGSLTLNGDHGTQRIEQGEAWFEAANSPVEAVAIENEPSQFVRAMILPIKYEGRSTFTLCDQKDASKPTLQRNTRHCEKIVSL